MSTPFMIQSANGVLAIDVDNGVYAEGTSILGNYLGAAPGAPVAANQGWVIIPDPLGSGHYLLVSGASAGFCIGLGVNVPPGGDVTDDATDRGTVLTLQALEPVDNHYQLWDFLPPSSGQPNVAFIQNPQTGYVIELQSHSTEGGLLVVNPRRISNDSFQLWTGIGQDGGVVPLPLVTMYEPGFELRGFTQYVFLPPNQGDHLVGISVTIDVITDIVVDAFSIQINCNSPYLGPDGVDTEDYDRDAEFMQFGLFLQNNELLLFTQTYHRPGPVPASEFTSVQETSAPMLTVQDNTIPAGTRIIMNLVTDQDDFVIGVTGIVLDITGLPIGNPIYWPALGRPSFHSTIDGGKIHQKAMAPIGAFQVVFCSNPNVQNSSAQFSAGMGTITTTAYPGISAQNYAPAPGGLGTDENSNMPYDLVPVGTSRLIAQPFGFPPARVIPPVHPKLGSGLQQTVIIEEPGGRIEVFPGDAPGGPIVIDDNPDSPGYDGR